MAPKPPHVRRPPAQPGCSSGARESKGPDRSGARPGLHVQAGAVLDALGVLLILSRATTAGRLGDDEDHENREQHAAHAASIAPTAPRPPPGPRRASAPEAETSPEVDGARLPDRDLECGERRPRRVERVPRLDAATAAVQQPGQIDAGTGRLEPPLQRVELLERRAEMPLATATVPRGERPAPDCARPTRDSTDGRGPRTAPAPAWRCRARGSRRRQGDRHRPGNRGTAPRRTPPRPRAAPRWPRSARRSREGRPLRVRTRDPGTPARRPPRPGRCCAPPRADNGARLPPSPRAWRR